MIRIAVIGDVVGRPGRRALAHFLPRVRSQYQPDLIIANCENSAGGFGITEKIYDELIGLGIDLLTSGNHWADKKDIFSFLGRADRFVVPANISNFPANFPSYRICKTPGGVEIMIINLIGRVFMNNGNSSPFLAIDKILSENPQCKIKLVDIHAEASSEKYALAHYLSKRVSCIWGTHTHIPTADEHIIDGSTAFISDVGMTGVYDSVIGIKKSQSIARFLGSEQRSFEAAEGNPWFCSVIFDINDSTGACTDLHRINWRDI